MKRYDLGKRRAAADETRRRIVAAARELVSAGASPSVGAVARRAGVSRITVYNRFGSRGGLLASLSPDRQTGDLPEGPPRDQLRRVLLESCRRWAADPALIRHLPSPPSSADDLARSLAERLADADELRPGCSIKEAEDVIEVLSSFATFDRLHHDGRRPPAAVAEILMRLAAGVLAYHP